MQIQMMVHHEIDQTSYWLQFECIYSFYTPSDALHFDICYLPRSSKYIKRVMDDILIWLGPQIELTRIIDLKLMTWIKISLSRRKRQNEESEGYHGVTLYGVYRSLPLWTQ